jgi:predicted O-methyltransferase YrrM
LKNVKVKQLDDVIVPLRVPSISAAQLLHCYQLKADMVYIDAAHDYESVQSDLAHYDGIVKVGGIIFGDDYKWSGVRRAVNEFAQQKQLIVLADHNTWVIQK